MGKSSCPEGTACDPAVARLCCSFPRAGLRAGAQIAPVCELGWVSFIPSRDYELLSPGLWAWSTRGRSWV